jgi:hypothetical protein
MSKADAKKFLSAAANTDLLDQSALKLMRMSLRGWDYSASELDLVDNQVNAIKQHAFSAASNRPSSKNGAPTNVIRISPAERLRSRTNETILSDLEALLDEWETTKSPQAVNVYDLINQYELKGAMPVKTIREWLIARIDDLKDTQGGFGHLSQLVISRRIKALEAMLTDVEAKKAANTSSRKKPIRTKSKAKVKTMDKVVSRVKYKKEDTGLQIVSIDPTKIVGAHRVFILNTRTNELHEYVSNHPNGLTIKGSSIIQFDEHNAFKQRVKVAFIQDVLKKTPRQINNGRKIMTSKVTEATGRLGKDMLILRVMNK